MTNITEARPRVLIEDWLPVAELGDESRRERTISVAIPPLFRVHVWWARRPLAASTGVVLAGLLPAWNEEVLSTVSRFLDSTEASIRAAILAPRPSLLPSRTYADPSEDWYHDWLLHLCGIWGDPVSARRRYDAAVRAGVRVPNPYNYKQAYKNSVERWNIDLLHHLLKATWGGSLPTVLDPTSGGGSIPYCASRLGLPVHANDLSGVAATILETCVKSPATYGERLDAIQERWGRMLTQRVADRMRPFFPRSESETIEFYLFANAVDCPRTGRMVPLAPNWWLRKKSGKECAVRLVVESNQDVTFEVLHGEEAKKYVSGGTVSRGSAISPYDDLAIDSEYIKSEAQAGRMRSVLYAVVLKNPNGGRSYRAPNNDDLQALVAAERRLSELRDEWEAEGLIPTGRRPKGFSDRSVVYGLDTWASLFSPRQLLVHGTFGVEFRRIAEEIRATLSKEDAESVLLALSLLQGKALNWNSRLSSWNVNQQSMRSVFDRHDFSFKWTFAEYEGADGLYPWSLHTLNNLSANAQLMSETGRDLTSQEVLPREVTVTRASAADLKGVADQSVGHVCIDPPYYDNVMYAELADFFYVWARPLDRSIRPQYFDLEESDKDNEAVANPVRFESAGRRKNELADLDYEAKMTAIFGECRRVLRPDGVLSVMFTHKRAEAWDTLGMGLLNAGFTVETSWPVNTEAENSLHQANVNSAASTIMLVCRKRESDGVTKIFLEEIESELRIAAREAAERFRNYGIQGVDLLLSTYGPALSVISSHWPVYSSDADEYGRARLLRPDEALAVAREEVVRMTRRRIVGRDVQIDNHSDFVLIAWETFKAYEFSFDEARRLALTVGALDIDELAQAKVLDKKSGTVRLLPPKDRIRRGSDDSSTGVRIDANKFEYMNDALDTVLYVAEVDGMGSAKSLMDRLGLTGDQRFLAYVQGLVNAMPRMKVKGEWVVPEAGLLDTLVTAYLPEITLPADVQESVGTVEEQTLFD